MATMVARGSSPLASSVSVQEKGSRNKRKFRADPPINDPNFLSSLQSDNPNYELFPMGKTSETGTFDHQQGYCDCCRNRALTFEEIEEQYQEAEWIDGAEAQLEETVLSNLDMIFKTAIKIIMTYGYTEDIATNAVLRAGLCYGCKDTVSNVVDNAMAYLRSSPDVDSSSRENPSEELKMMERNVLNEMVHVVRDFRPYYSRGDALWRLLCNDMNVTLACTMDSNPLPSIGSEQTSASSIAPHVQQESNELNAPSPNKPSLVFPYPQNSSEAEMPPVVGIPSLPCGRFSASINVQGQVSALASAKENAIASLDCVIEETSALYLSQPSGSEGKSTSGRKSHLGSSKRDSILRQKALHFEKNYRMFGSKSAIRAGKNHNGLGGLLLDKKNKAISDSNAKKNTVMKLNKAVGSDSPKADPTPLNLSFKEATPKTPVPAASTELSLSLPSMSSSSGSSVKSSVFETGFSYANWDPEMDDMLQKLDRRERELQDQLQEWSDWAHQKVMQATRRLSKDKPELQSLRQEKEEVARLKKEKQTLEENTRKKLAEMEIALSKASAQVEKANADARRLERENSELRKEMEAAKVRAAESAASCREVLEREATNLKKIQSWEKQKGQLHEELAIEKKKFSQLRQQLGQAKEQYDQVEARWKHEEKAKEEALILRNNRRKEREQIEVSGRAKENEMRIRAETDLQRHKENIKKLEQQISQLRQRVDSSKIAALKWGPDGSYASRLSDPRKESKGGSFPKFSEFEDSEEVQRDRECVMCLTDEMSVVFLPCAHQVVCKKCNELHEKQGMKDCPSCRTLIEKRICVRSA
ncbi:uncharacterized protein A4U43_C02F19870 [Asparagus officinalis]|uniref:RING-type domain-containing protein n=1 Tax=Asparagus officinalis TaxID=4686 RepID=A0A5P1FMB5_ASPOF|nr:putative E3 ubiquitin-protein ligase RF298 [Asparagus officinalis]ONK78537.1 uncharacterized protein A4U43_C02F19870 [Asparagus officinalis]